MFGFEVDDLGTIAPGDYVSSFEVENKLEEMGFEKTKSETLISNPTRSTYRATFERGSETLVIVFDSMGGTGTMIEELDH